MLYCSEYSIIFQSSSSRLCSQTSTIFVSFKFRIFSCALYFNFSSELPKICSFSAIYKKLTKKLKINFVLEPSSAGSAIMK